MIIADSSCSEIGCDLLGCGDTMCDHTSGPGGPSVRQVARRAAAGGRSPQDSEGYEILLLNQSVYRNTEGFRR